VNAIVLLVTCETVCFGALCAHFVRTCLPAPLPACLPLCLPTCLPPHEEEDKQSICKMVFSKSSKKS
jgi:hypothetical protein